MITYDRLSETPDGFLPLTGLAADEFDRLFEAFVGAAEAHRVARTHTKRGHRRLRRAAGWEDQKPFYSGKKKRHTLKSQVVVTPGGRIASVSKTAPGRTHDLTVLRHTRVLGNLPAEAGVMTDKGYVGVEADAGNRRV